MVDKVRVSRIHGFRSMCEMQGSKAVAHAVGALQADRGPTEMKPHLSRPNASTEMKMQLQRGMGWQTHIHCSVKRTPPKNEGPSTLPKHL